VKRSPCLVLLFFVAAAFPLLTAQVEAEHRITPLAKVKFVGDEDVKCLSYAVESGDPDKGASTMILKAPPKCVVRWHYHTAVEGLMVVRGDVLTEMESLPATSLEPGGFATMRSEEKHQFTCAGKAQCILFVTFDRVYDIHWVKENK
jgi:quercetin dioxygenase-like cupin family protein